MLLVILGASSVQASAWNFFDALPKTQAKAVKKRPKILFVGNSHTFVNNMPEMLKKICNKNGISPQITTVVHGSYSLYQYAYPGKNKPEEVKLGKKLKKLLKSQKWDYVILQDRRYEALVNPVRMKKAVKALQPLIKKSGAQMVFYLTWPPKAGQADYRKGWASSPSDYLSRTADVYYTLAEKYKAALAPSGIAFYRASTILPEIELYNSDRKHASPAGSYLSACVIYATLFGKSPEGTAYYPAISGVSRQQCVQIGKSLQSLAADVTIRGSKKDRGTLRFTAAETVIKSGEKKKLSYQIVSGTSGTRVVSWYSDNKKAVTVDKSGNVTGHLPGTAKITARLSNNSTASCTVRVTKEGASTGGTSLLSLEKSSATVYVGKKMKLNVSSGGAAGGLKFVSSNAKIVSVDDKGVMTAKAAGNVHITVTAADGQTAVCDVRSIVAAKKISFSHAKSGLKLKKGQTKKLQVSFTPSKATVKTLKWSSGNPNVVKVFQSGKIKALKKGTAVITATTTDGTNLKIQIKIKVV